MKTKLNIFFAVVLFCSTTFAGDVGNGGAQGCTQNCPPPPCTENCGGRPEGAPGEIEGTFETDIVLFAIGQYLGISL